MAYSKVLPSGKRLRQQICKIVSINEINQLADEHMNYHNENKSIPETLNVA